MNENNTRIFVREQVKTSGNNLSLECTNGYYVVNPRIEGMTIKFECYPKEEKKEEKKMNFGEALIFLKQYKQMKRKGWNGKNLSVHMFDPFEENLTDELLEADIRQYPYFRILDRTNKSINTWVPSVSDILAEDWCFYEQEEKPVLKGE